MLVSFSFIRALPELLTTQRDLNSSSSHLESLLAARKTGGLTLVPSNSAAKHTLIIHFIINCLQTNIFRSLSIVVLDTMLFQTHVSLIAFNLDRGYLYLIENLRVCKICRISL